MKAELGSTDSAFFVRLASAFVAAIVTFMLIPYLLRSKLFQAHKLWALMAITAAAVCTISGFLHIRFTNRLLAMVHAIPMLCLSGYCLYVSMPFFFGPAGIQDNAAGGAIVSANIFVVGVGLVTAACGVAVLRFAFERRTRT